MESRENQILEKWLENIESHDDIEVFLKSVLENKKQIVNGYEDVFLPNQLSCCVLSFLGQAAHQDNHEKNNKGHYEITQDIIKNFCPEITNKLAIRNFARASVLPDLIYFDQLQYHAQTVSEDNGKPIYHENENAIDDPEGNKNRENFIVFIKQQLQELQKSAQPDNFDATNFFHYSGILFHAIEDFACHRGMTNPEHAYLNKKKQCPDLEPGIYEFGVLVTQKFFEKFMKEICLNALDHINKTTESTRWFPFEKIQTFKKLYAEGKKFKKLSEKYNPRNSVRWFEWYNSKSTEKALATIEKEIFDKI